ncbi:hypothetical protein L195_g033858 [Trifolium pratense]|uniref:Reverse transcriptase zinc-binding domain-containing protein n=1 Tax=Trifolium pratense TaxID=57577 RepID=A0A2K3LH66_TRIPR|nr:hypothetical protein L195_g033858 [Trifolium pratense]
MVTRLKVPPKVKNLIWRICHGCCPTRARLREKEVSLTTTTVADAVFFLLQKLDTLQAALWAVIVWSIWKHRKLKLWNNVTETNLQIFKHAKHMIEDWRLANTIKPKHPTAGIDYFEAHVPPQSKDLVNNYYLFYIVTMHFRLIDNGENSCKVFINCFFLRQAKKLELLQREFNQGTTN